ncbi:MAG: diaminobutyrate acetyltransferase [Haliea sp.]|nr:diaminobutyrate acetyltransferase [Haliea sp.]
MYIFERAMYFPDGINLRQPESSDGAGVSHLIARCPPLDTNSVYCNLLQCTHFAGTSVAALRDDELVGFTSGYLPPEQPDTLFIWQVAVDEAARGQGLAARMLTEILARPHCQNVRWLETSITAANSASLHLFEGFAARQGVQASRDILFDQQQHFKGDHATEYLLRIGPLHRPAPQTTTGLFATIPANSLSQE